MPFSPTSPPQAPAGPANTIVVSAVTAAVKASLVRMDVLLRAVDGSMDVSCGRLVPEICGLAVTPPA